MTHPKKNQNSSDPVFVLQTSQRLSHTFHLPGDGVAPIRTVPGPCVLPAAYANRRFLDSPELLIGDAAKAEWGLHAAKYIPTAQSVPGLRLAAEMDSRPEISAACNARITFLTKPVG